MYMLTKKPISTLKVLDKKIKAVKNINSPRKGWIREMRTSLNMSMQQLGKRMGLSAQGVHALEKREQEGTISMNKLEAAASAMGMELSYMFTPKTSLENFVTETSYKKAEALVKRSQQTMKLENQGVGPTAYEDQIKTVQYYLKENLSELWDD